MYILDSRALTPRRVDKVDVVAGHVSQGYNSISSTVHSFDVTENVISPFTEEGSSGH